jgi:hypothetical protein
MKNLDVPFAMECMTFWVVVQCLNQLHDLLLCTPSVLNVMHEVLMCFSVLLRMIFLWLELCT